jgi:glycosyltransferase involved in cell wall biosynthesis
MGGAEKRFVETLKAFCREGDLQFTILESAPSLLEEVACEKHSVPSGFSGRGWLGTYLEWTVWIAKSSFNGLSLARRAKPDLIFVPNNTLPNLLSGYIVGSVFHRPVCVVVHHIDILRLSESSRGHSLYANYRNVKYGRLVSFAKTLAFYVALPLLNRAQAIIAVSNFTAKTLRGNHVAQPKIFVSGNAVNLDLIDRTEPCSEEKVFDGVFVGRIAKEKGIFDLLKIWEEVTKVRRNAKLLIIGSGVEMPAFKERIAEAGLQNKISLRGRCHEKELYGLLKSSKLFIFPSVFEGWGIAVAEALACGLPTVAYDIPAIREVFGTCKSVFLVPTKNVESMTSMVLDILNSDESKMHELRNDSKAYARRFIWKKISDKDSLFLRNLSQ